jgi:hypothetical protein
MKRNFTLFLLTISVGSFALLSHHNGVAEEQNKDRTGAPGSSQPCTHCHSPTTSFNASSVISILDIEGNEISEYIPGIEYDVEFIVSASGASAYGFQATSVLANGSNAGEFFNPGTNVQLEAVGSRHIVEQSNQHVSGVFTTSWMAPETGSGSIGFYMAGLAVNLGSGNNGDSHHATALSLTEGINDGVSTTTSNEMNQPIITDNGINWTSPTSGTFEVYDLSGKLFYSTHLSTNEDLSIPGGDFSSGIHILRFTPIELNTYSPKSWKVIIPS